MSVNEPMVKYGALLDSLRELVQSGSTGTLFVATNDNHSANFGFEDGEIVAGGPGLHGAVLEVTRRHLA